jgi:hypothetical protein
LKSLLPETHLCGGFPAFFGRPRQRSDHKL